MLVYTDAVRFQLPSGVTSKMTEGRIEFVTKVGKKFVRMKKSSS